MGGDWTSTFELDGTAPEEVAEQFDRGWFRGREYRYLTAARHGIERGTAVVDGVVVRGYPSLPRALVLDPTVPDYFDGPVVVEEKLNGYNVRLARVGGDLLAFTRSGFVCPYTTDILAETVTADEFFDDHPDRMLCGELVGPENPYTAHDYEEVDSAAFYVFDIRDRESGQPMPVERRRDCCGEYGLDSVRAFGTVTPTAAVDTVRDAIRRLDARGREGVVVKSVDGRRALKYTTSAIHRADLSQAFELPFDYGREFVFPRVVREAFQAVEFEESPEAVRERARKLGEAILTPAVETIRAVEAGDPVGETHTVRGDPETLDALLSHFREQGLALQIERDDREDGERVVTFTKVARATRDKTEYYLTGGTIDE